MDGESTLPVPAVRLLKQLSRNIYSSFKVGLKEFVLNSFDAGALSVEIVIDPMNRSLTIKDDGEGMTNRDVYNFFLRAGATSRALSTSTKYRPTIGYKGVGAFSVFYFAEGLVIRSRREESEGVQCEVDLAGLRATELDESVGTPRVLRWERLGAEYPIGTEIAIQRIDQRSFESVWDSDVKVSEQPLFTYLSEVLPVPFDEADRGLRLSAILGEEQSELTRWSFYVKLNGERVLRHSPYRYFERYKLLDQFYVREFDGKVRDDIRVKGVLFGTVSKIKDERFVGLLVRNNNVSIGPRRDNPFDMRSRPHMLQWVSGEIHIYGNINEDITTDRERLVEDGDLYHELRKLVESYLAPFLTELQDHSEEIRARKQEEQEVRDSETFVRAINEFSKQRNLKGEIHLVPGKETEPIVTGDASKRQISINTNSRAAAGFSRWNDKELFYSFLAFLQNRLSDRGDPHCRDLVIQAQTDFDVFLRNKKDLESDQLTYGF